MKEISVIIPFYNTPIKYIDFLINESGLNLYRQYEIIWIDDGSNFEISNYVKNVCLHNEWIYYRFQKNVGVSKARNKGIELSSSNFIMFLDSDDVLNIERLILFREYGKYDLVLFNDGIFVSDVVFDNSDIYFTKIDRTIDQLYGNNEFKLNLRSVWGKILKKQIIVDNNLKFDEDLPFYEDAIFMCRYYQHCNNYVAIGNTLYYYRVYNDSSSKKFNKDYINKYEIFYFRFKNEFNKFNNYISGLEQDTFDRMMIDKVIRSIEHGHVLYSFAIIKSVPVKESAVWVINNRSKKDFSYKLALLINKKLYLLSFIKIVFHQFIKSIIIRYKKLKKIIEK